MDLILKQVGELLLGAVPTIVLLLSLYAIYSVLLHKPLRRVLDQRRERTEGAFAKARTDIAVAEARTQEYEQRLREARLAIFKAQEARRQLAQQARADAVMEARTRAQEQVRKAHTAIEEEMGAARAGLQAEVERLAAEIIRTILRPAGVVPGVGGPA